MDRQQDRRYFLGMYKSLKYTGKTSWKAFYTKLRGYARTAGWTEEQKKDQLLWSLEDKTATASLGSSPTTSMTIMGGWLTVAVSVMTQTHCTVRTMVLISIIIM
jgi:hypothetical protein